MGNRPEGKPKGDWEFQSGTSWDVWDPTEASPQSGYVSDLMYQYKCACLGRSGNLIKHDLAPDVVELDNG